MRRSLIGMAVTIAMVTALAAPPAAAAGARPDPLARYRSQTLQWAPCVEGLALECATMVAPRDWHHPGIGEDVRVAVSRLRAGDPKGRHGVMLLNPGGPGASGLFMPLAFTDQPIAEAFDLIGFDPRGVGDSTRIRCQTVEEFDAWIAQDYRDRSPANIGSVLRTARGIAGSCLERSGELLRFISTDQTVRDMDLIRDLLDEGRISYLGYSGGTWLGAQYATVFPGRVDRFVFDSNTEFTTTWENSFDWQPLGFERRFNQDFLAWMARNDDVFHYGATARATRARWEARRRALQRQPLEVSDIFTLRAGNFDSGTIGIMYSKAAFPALAAALVALEHWDTASPDEKQLVEGVFGSFFDESLYAVFYAITCNDTRWHRGPRFWVAFSGALGLAFPLIGYSWISQPCAFWPFEQPKPLDVDGRRLPTVLMINSVHDPATPIEGALRAHRAFRGSRLVTVVGEGDHGIYGGGNACVNGIANRFLVRGQAPSRDAICQGMPLPEPVSAAASRTLAGPDQRSSENILDRIEELTRRYGHAA